MPDSNSHNSQMFLYHDIKSEEALIEDEEDFHYRKVKSKFQTHLLNRTAILTTLNVLLLAVTIFINVSTLFNTLVKNSAEKSTSWYSPVLDTIDVERHHVQFNGTIWPGDNPSWTRIEPGDEADEMWRQFDPIFAIPITREDVIKLGKDPDYVAKFEDDYWGFGDDAYIGALDVFHQLHCLNALREASFAPYLNRTARRDEMNLIHMRHCVDMIAQNIICHADADIHTYQWMDTQWQPFPDFSINRQCRNYDELIRWRDERVVDMEKYKGMRKPTGVKQVPAEPEFYEKFGYAGSDLFPEKAREAHEAFLEAERRRKEEQERTDGVDLMH